jgi:hypothetical protein
MIEEDTLTDGEAPVSEEALRGDMVQLREFIACSKEKEQLDAKLKEVNAKLAKLQDPLLAFFASSGMQRITVDGRTAYVWGTVRGRLRDGVERTVAVEALRVHAPELVAENFNLNAVSSWLNELRTSSNAITVDQFSALLPEEIRAAFELQQVNAIRVVAG